MSRQKYKVGDSVLVGFDKEIRNWNALTRRDAHIESIGKIGQIREATQSSSLWYYKLSGDEELRDVGYFHENMLLPAKLDPQEAETRLVRGELTYDAYQRVIERV